MTQALQLDCLDQLAATPAILRGLMCGLSVEDTEWKPTPELFGSGSARASFPFRGPLLSNPRGPVRA